MFWRIFKWWLFGGIALLAVFFVAVIIVAAVEDGDDDAPASPTPRAVSTAAPEATRTAPASECPTAAERTYFLALAEESGTLGPAVTSLGEHFEWAGEDATLFLDEDWRFGVALSLAFIEGSAKDMLALNPPSFRTRGIQVQVAIAASDFLLAVDLLERGIDDLDADTFERGADHVISGGDALLQASAAVESICQ